MADQPSKDLLSEQQIRNLLDEANHFIKKGQSLDSILVSAWALEQLCATALPQSAANEPEHAITNAAVHAMCVYIRDKACSGCSGKIDTPYGSGTPGCFAIAREHIETALRVTSTKSPDPYANAPLTGPGSRLQADLTKEGGQ